MSEDCADKSCCVLPIVVSYMLAILLRQTFEWVRNRVSVWPPYTLLVFGLACITTVVTNTNQAAHDKLDKYMNCMLDISSSTLLHVVLPLLVFQPTFTTEMQMFKRSLNQVLLLAVTGFLLMVFLTGVIVSRLYSWQIENSLIFGVIVCFTDPLAVAEVVRVSGVSPNLAALLHGESVISGAMAFISFRLFACLSRQNSHDMQTMRPAGDSHVQELTSLIVETMFAPFVGLAFAMLTVTWIGRIFNETTLEITIVLSLVNIAYLVSEMMYMPGMVTVVVMGLFLSSSRASISHAVEYSMHQFICMLTDIFHSVVFFFSGARLVTAMFENGFTWGDLGVDVLLYLVVIILRGLAVFFLSPVLRRMGYGMSWDHTLTVWLGALNGSHNILLCLLAVEGYDGYKLDRATKQDYKFFHSVMTVILLKQLINTSITRGLLKTFGLRSMPHFKILGLSNAMRILKDVRNKTLNALKSDRFMADADFDIVESDTLLEDMFRRFNQIYLDEKPRYRPKVRSSVVSVERIRDERAESILILLKAQKKTYWRHYDRGLMSKEALHRLLEWADEAADHRGKYLDVGKVMQASKVTPFMKQLKRQFRVKLKQMQQEKYRQNLGGWQYLQDILPVVALNVWHVIDFLLIFLAIAVEFVSGEDYTSVWREIYNDLLLYNILVVGLYGMITLGELLVMRLRFFKIVWYDISLLVVVVGMLDVLVMYLVPKRDYSSVQAGGQTYIRVCFILSRMVRRLGQIELSQFLLRETFRLVENRISDRVSVGFDICCAYVAGQVEVSRQVDQLFSDPNICDDLKRHCNKSKLQIIRTLGILSLEHRNISLNVKTRQAMRIVLNSQHDSIKQLKEEGVLNDTDAAMLIKSIEVKMKRLLTSPPLVDDNADDNIIRNIGWVQGDPALYQFIKERTSILNLKAGAVLADQGEESYTIFIVRSGVVRLERREGGYQLPVIDYLTAGNVLGEINFLTKTARHKSVRCETPATVMLLMEDALEEAVTRTWTPSLPPLIYRMWLGVAKRVAIKVYMENIAFQGISKERLRMRLVNAYLVDDTEGCFIDITPDFGDVILVHGHAMDTFTRLHFKGPCLIPCSTFQLQMLPGKGLYTLVLMVPNHPVEDAAREINPNRHRSELDGTAMALSSSFDGLRLLASEPNFYFKAHVQSKDNGMMNERQLNVISPTTTDDMVNQADLESRLFQGNYTSADDSSDESVEELELSLEIPEPEVDLPDESSGSEDSRDDMFYDNHRRLSHRGHKFNTRPDRAFSARHRMSRYGDKDADVDLEAASRSDDSLVRRYQN